MRPRLASFAVLLFAAGSSLQANAQLREAQIVESAANTLSEFVAIPNQNIPTSLLARSEGLVIIPGMLKVGIIGGVRRGKGIVVIRDQNGSWKPPVFATMTGGSIGWQAGVQATDVVHRDHRCRFSPAGFRDGGGFHYQIQAGQF